MLNTPFSPWPAFTQEEAAAVSEVLLSNRVNYWTGEQCQRFEAEFADWIGAKHAIAMANGTVALDAALAVFNLAQGDEVIVTPRTFLASASCIVNAGAKPVFADVDPISQNITAETIAAVISPKTKGIICVHLAGWPCDMAPIMALANSLGLFVIEDCAQAHGARYQGQAVGTLGHIAAWSFCQDKIMTTGGEGGMVTTNNTDYWQRMWSLKEHGKNWHKVHETSTTSGFRWLHDSFGTNWRMAEIQAVIGRLQLKNLAQWQEQRLANAMRIWQCAQTITGLRVSLPPETVSHAAYKCYLFIEPCELASAWCRDRILTEINVRGVPCYSGSCSEIYLERAFDGTGLRPQRRLPQAKSLGETSLMFLVHPTLTEAEITKTCAVLRAVMKLAAK